MDRKNNTNKQEQKAELIQLEVIIGESTININTLHHDGQSVIDENTIIAYLNSINTKIPFETMYKDILQAQRVNFPFLVTFLISSEIYQVIPIETLHKLYTKINHYMNFYSKIFIINTKIQNIPWFENTAEYKLYLQKDTFDLTTIVTDNNSHGLENLLSFVSWNVKKQHNFMFLYLQKAVMELENKYLKDKMILKKESNLTNYEKELIKKYLVVIPSDIKKTKKGIAINFRYIINLILDDNAVFTVKLKEFLYENKSVYFQFIQYIKEMTLYLRFINLADKQDLSPLNNIIEDKYLFTFAEESINKGLISKTLISKLFNLFISGNDLIHALFIANVSKILIL